MDGWVDIGQAAEILGMSKDAVRKRIQRGTLPAEKIDGQWYIRLDDIQDILKDEEAPNSFHSELLALRARVQELEERLRDKQEEINFLRSELERKDVLFQQHLRALPPPEEQNQALVQLIEELRQEREELRKPWWKKLFGK